MTNITSRPSPSIPDLYGQLERAYAVMQAQSKCQENTPEHKRWQRTVDRVCRLAEKIATAPATNVAEVLIKLRVVAFDAGSVNPGGTDGALADYDRWEPGNLDSGTQMEAIASIRNDLVRMFGHLPEPWNAPGGFQRPLTGVPPHGDRSPTAGLVRPRAVAHAA
jgi:hypothetical protein